MADGFVLVLVHLFCFPHLGLWSGVHEQELCGDMIGDQDIRKPCLERGSNSRDIGWTAPCNGATLLDFLLESWYL